MCGKKMFGFRKERSLWENPDNSGTTNCPGCVEPAPQQAPRLKKVRCSSMARVVVMLGMSFKVITS